MQCEIRDFSEAAILNVYEHRLNLGIRPADLHTEPLSLIEPVDASVVCCWSAQTLSLGPIPKHDRSIVDGSKTLRSRRIMSREEMEKWRSRCQRF